MTWGEQQEKQERHSNHFPLLTEISPSWYFLPKHIPQLEPFRGGNTNLWFVT